MTKFWCLLGLHDWWCIHVKHYIDTSGAKDGKGVTSTAAVWRCTTCAATKDKTFFGMGFIEIAQFNCQPSERLPPLKLLLGGKNRHDKS